MNKKQKVALKAIEFIKEGMILGLGTGSTAYYFVEEVGKLVASGMNLQCVCTSLETEEHAKKLNIPLLSIDEVDYIDIDIDGADEIDYQFNAIKGGGGALFREKLVASISREVIWIVDDSKLVKKLGKFPLPIEILPFGYKQTLKCLSAFNPVLRMENDKPYITDNNHYIVDLHLGFGFDIKKVEEKLAKVVGVLETGLFLKMCKRVIIGYDRNVKILEKDDK